jgi:hypothetical protein
MSNAALDLFGSFLISNVRDRTISGWSTIFDGKMKGERATRITQLFTGFTEGQIAAIRLLIPQVVDSALHNLLWALEQTQNVRVGIKSGDVEVPSINEVSDGLAGELPSSEGWIARFSKHPPT